MNVPSPTNDNTPQPASRPQWFDDLLLRHLKFLRRICAETVGDLDHEDYYQETLSNILRYWHRFNRDGRFPTWCRFIMGTTGRTMREKNSSLARQDALISSDGVLQPNQEIATDLAIAVASIPRRRRKIARLVAAGYTAKEIAKACRITESTAYWRVLDLRQALRAANDNEVKRAA